MTAPRRALKSTEGEDENAAPVLQNKKAEQLPPATYVPQHSETIATSYYPVLKTLHQSVCVSGS